MATQSKSSSCSISTITKNKKIEVILLVSSCSPILQQRTNQNRARTILNGAINASLPSSWSWSSWSSSSSQEEVVIKEIDAADPSNKELRTELFQVSGIRGNYPQIFIHRDEKQAENGSVSATTTSTIGYNYVGGFAELEAYNDSGSLLKTILLIQENGDDEGAENDANTNQQQDEEGTPSLDKKKKEDIYNIEKAKPFKNGKIKGKTGIESIAIAALLAATALGGIIIWFA